MDCTEIESFSLLLFAPARISIGVRECPHSLCSSVRAHRSVFSAQRIFMRGFFFFFFLVNGYSCRKALFFLIITSHHITQFGKWKRVDYILKLNEKKYKITTTQRLSDWNENCFLIYSLRYFRARDNHVDYNISFHSGMYIGRNKCFHQNIKIYS